MKEHQVGYNSLLIALIEEAGLSVEEAKAALITFASFAMEQYPILRGNIRAFVQHEILHLQCDMHEEVGGNLLVADEINVM